MRRVLVFIDAPRVGCTRCGSVRITRLLGVVPVTNHTHSLVRLIVDLRKMMTIQDIAGWLGVSTTWFETSTSSTLKLTLANHA